MSKRSFRRLAVVAGAALAVGSMAPALAVRIDAGAGAEAEIDPTMVVNDVVNITGALPLPELSDANGLVDNVLDHATLLGLGLGGSLLGADCGLVAVASCNTTPVVDADIPVNAAGLNVLGGGILNNTGDLGLGVIAPIAVPVVASVLDGGILNAGLLGGPLGGLLDVAAAGNVNVLAGLLASL